VEATAKKKRSAKGDQGRAKYHPRIKVYDPWLVNLLPKDKNLRQSRRRRASCHFEPDAANTWNSPPIR
jgi:hypothetical protein